MVCIDPPCALVTSPTPVLSPAPGTSSQFAAKLCCAGGRQTSCVLLSAQSGRRSRCIAIAHVRHVACVALVRPLQCSRAAIVHLNCLSLGPSVAWCSSPFLDDGMRQMNWLPGPILKNLLLHGGHQCACRGPIFFSISLLYFQQGNRVLLCFRIFQRAVCTLIECALHSFNNCRQEHVLLAHLRALYS